MDVDYISKHKIITQCCMYQTCRGQDKKGLSCLYFFCTLRYFHFSFHLYQTSFVFSFSPSFVTRKPSIGGSFILEVVMQSLFKFVM